jgi:hypothetical protein
MLGTNLAFLVSRALELACITPTPFTACAFCNALFIIESAFSIVTADIGGVPIGPSGALEVAASPNETCLTGTLGPACPDIYDAFDQRAFTMPIANGLLFLIEGWAVNVAGFALEANITFAHPTSIAHDAFPMATTGCLGYLALRTFGAALRSHKSIIAFAVRLPAPMHELLECACAWATAARTLQVAVLPHHPISTCAGGFLPIFLCASSKEKRFDLLECPLLIKIRMLATFAVLIVVADFELEVYVCHPESFLSERFER